MAAVGDRDYRFNPLLIGASFRTGCGDLLLRGVVMFQSPSDRGVLSDTPTSRSRVPKEGVFQSPSDRGVLSDFLALVRFRRRRDEVSIPF